MCKRVFRRSKNVKSDVIPEGRDWKSSEILLWLSNRSSEHAAEDLGRIWPGKLRLRPIREQHPRHFRRPFKYVPFLVIFCSAKSGFRVKKIVEGFAVYYCRFEEGAERIISGIFRHAVCKLVDEDSPWPVGISCQIVRTRWAVIDPSCCIRITSTAVARCASPFWLCGQVHEPCYKSPRKFGQRLYQSFCLR